MEDIDKLDDGNKDKLFSLLIMWCKILKLKKLSLRKILKPP